MGLMVHSLEGMPTEHSRDYFIYLLDYGWSEPLGDALRNNFNQMAARASEQKNAVVVMSADAGVHFSDEVLSWHNINGEEAENEELLPAILVTNRHPAEFRKRAKSETGKTEANLKMILFPLKKYCNTTTEVMLLIQRIFTSIKLGKDLDDFGIVKEKRKGTDGALANSILVEPGFTGDRFSYDQLINYFK